MTKPEPLPLGDVLSVTTGLLVSRDGMGGVYRVCDYMTGESNFTHQLPRVADECRPLILAQHPELADVEVPDFGDAPDADAVFAWLSEMERQYGETVELSPLTANDHTSIDPIAELQMMRPDMPIIEVEV